MPASHALMPLGRWPQPPAAVTWHTTPEAKGQDPILRGPPSWRSFMGSGHTPGDSSAQANSVFMAHGPESPTLGPRRVEALWERPGKTAWPWADQHFAALGRALRPEQAHGKGKQHPKEQTVCEREQDCHVSS